MDSKMQVLKLYFDALGIKAEPDEIKGDLEARLVLQKAVYLGRLVGVNFGYRYGWYVRGPYSSDLTKDYYALATALQVDKSLAAGLVLTPEVGSAVNKIKPLLDPPKASRIGKPAWLELLASYNFLHEANPKAKHEELVSILKTEKPNIYKYADQARDALKTVKPLTIS